MELNRDARRARVAIRRLSSPDIRPGLTNQFGRT